MYTCVYICVYMCICVRVCIHMCIYAYMCTRVYTSRESFKLNIMHDVEHTDYRSLLQITVFFIGLFCRSDVSFLYGYIILHHA